MTAAGPIVHATDFSAASRPAFREALSLARRRRAPLLIVHVVSPLVQVPEATIVSPPTYARFVEAAEAGARARLRRLVDRAREAGVRASGVVLRGIPHEAIVQEARRRRARTIVIGTHGRSGLPRLLIGSVAARILAHARCPVLTVRAPAGRRAAP